MKKLLITAGIAAMLVALAAAVPVAGAADDSTLVYKAALIDIESTPGTASGEVSIWNDGRVKIQLFTDPAMAGQTYSVRMDWGMYPLTTPFPGRVSYALGYVVTGANGNAVGFLDLSATPYDVGTPLLSPGFLLILQPPAPGAPAPVAATGLLKP